MSSLPSLRISILIVLCFLVASGLTLRLFSTSVLEHKVYLAAAADQQTVFRDVLPKRGTITVQDTATGKTQIVAESVERFALSATPKNVIHKHEYAELLASFTGTDEKTLEDTFDSNGLYMNPIEHDLTQDQVQSLAQKINDLERSFDPTHTDESVDLDASQGSVLYFLGGTFFIREYQRIYPEGAMLAQVLGFVNDHGDGQYGFEEEYNQQLKGYLGQLSIQQDSLGTLLSANDTVQGQDGTSYELSIDRNVQYEVEQQLALQVKNTQAQGGTAIVMNPKTGEIVAMASVPTYDPANFRTITPDQVTLFDNPAISSVKEPGSVMKVPVMSAAIDTGVVNPDEVDDYPESVTVEGHVIETALRKAYGKEDAKLIIANSDNVAMVSVANKLGNQTMYDYLRKFGFGSPTGVDLKNEVDGSILPVDQWKDINRATIAFGQGIAVTAMQMIDSYAIIANGGKLAEPHIVHAIINPDGTRQLVPTVEGPQILKPSTVDIMKNILAYTVQYAHNRAGTPGYVIGGKTGTAQVPDPVNGGYLTDTYNHSFIGMGPMDDPKYVMLINIDEPNLNHAGLFAESTAVPLFGNLSTFLLNYYQIQPTNK